MNDQLDVTPPSEAHRRLEELLNYVEQVTRLDERPVFTLNAHRLGGGQAIAFHQQDFFGLDGIILDQEDEDGPIWITIKRLRRGEPPQSPPDIVDWLIQSSEPDVMPKINGYITKTISKEELNHLLETGKIRRDDYHEAMGEAAGKYDVSFRLEDNKPIQDIAEYYINNDWLTWAEKERPVRKSIRIYQKFFEIIQKKEISIDLPFEIVWGIGVTRWKKDGKEIDLPIIECLTEIELDESNGGEIRVRPRLQKPIINLRPYDELKIEGAALALNSARKLIDSMDDEDGLSPFKPETYEPILRICQSYLDVDARYILDDASIKLDAELPRASENLLISNRWVIFARRRSENFLLQDIINLKHSVKHKEDLPKPAQTLVSGPADEQETQWQSLSNAIGSTSSGNDTFREESPLGDLFFPKPFNNDQIEIVRRLEKSEGVVVQGPPGTGKTHTISNIICHYLALGKRVLVVSHGEPALAVLRDQLPEQVRDLAISITSTEREGLKQVETAARLMQSIIQNLIPSQQRTIISELEANIVGMRNKLASVDKQIAEIANKQLSLVPNLQITPGELAERVVKSREKYGWLTDSPTKFSNEIEITDDDIHSLGNARQALGNNLVFIDDILPSINELPEAIQISEWHEGIVRANALTEKLTTNKDYSIKLSTFEDAEAADKIAKALQDLLDLRKNLNQINWLQSIADSLVSSSSHTQIIVLLRGFVEEASKIVEEHYLYLEKPVEAPETLYENQKALEIIDRLSEGHKVFGLLDFSSRSIRPEIEKIRVSNKQPNSAEEWAFVKSHIKWNTNLKAINLKWRRLSIEINAVELDLTSPKTLSRLVNILRTVTHLAPEIISGLEIALPKLVVNSKSIREFWLQEEELYKLNEIVRDKIAIFRLNSVKNSIEKTISLFDREKGGQFSSEALDILLNNLGNSTVSANDISQKWHEIRVKIAAIQSNHNNFEVVRNIANKIREHGAANWSYAVSHECHGASTRDVCPSDWKEAWDWAASNAFLYSINQREELRSLSSQRIDLDHTISKSFEKLVRERAFYSLGSHMNSSVKSALMMFATALKKIGSGTGKSAGRHRRAAREAMSMCYGAIPCWIMPSWRVAEQLPGEVGSFDLVIMDEASQADIREVTTLLRGKKILVVGDDKQVSPTAAFIETSKIDQLERGYLKNQPFRTLLLPGSSLYDLAKVMFPDKFIMLKEHFRCVEPIIRFSMQFYQPEPLIPLRIPMPAERLSPPLVDIYVPDGFRTGDKLNNREADVIVQEIKNIVDDPKLGYIETQDKWRTIGVVSLIGSKQANLIYKKLISEIGEELISRHRIACGDSATFQGNEKDIIFLSMIADPKNKQAQTAIHFEQRFNVALSRARDRMILVHSVTLDDLKPHDLKAKVLQHFINPMGDEKRKAKRELSAANLKNNDKYAYLMSQCDSDFEREILRRLLDLGYQVTPQVGSQGYSIDLVVEGGTSRLAIECDGDKYHGPEKWASDMSRQRILERVGWRFWRCWASSFQLDPEGCMNDLIDTLHNMGILPNTEGDFEYQFTEFKIASQINEADKNLEIGAVADKSDRISVGDRVIVRDYLTNKTITYTLTPSRTDELNGLLGVDTPLGASLIGLDEEDEVELNVDGKLYRLLIVRWEPSDAKIQ